MVSVTKNYTFVAPCLCFQFVYIIASSSVLHINREQAGKEVEVLYSLIVSMVSIYLHA